MCKCNGKCGCGSITIPKGDKGDSGAVVNYIVNNVTYVAAAVLRYFQQILGQTYDIYNTAAGKDIAIITVPTVTSTNQLILNFNCQVDATDINNVTVAVFVNNVGQLARKITMPAKVGGSAKTWAEVILDCKLAVVTGDVIKVNVLSDAAGVTPRLTDYFWEVELLT